MSSAVRPSSGGATTTAVRRRRDANAAATSGGWSRKPAPRTATADGSGAGTMAHAEHLPRAGAPPPPRGEVNVWRPWGRHGAAALPPAPRIGDGSDGMEGGAATPEVAGVAGTGAGLAAAAVTAVTEGDRGRPGGRAADDAQAGAGAAAGGGGAAKGKAKRMRWEPKYLTVKAVFFLFYSSLGAIMPYLPVYYHTLGIPDR